MTPPLTNEQLDELLEMEKRATPGHWEVKSEQDAFDRWWVYGVFAQHGVKHVYNKGQSTESTSYCGYVCEPHTSPAESFQDSSANMEFIAASRNAIRQLVEEVKAHREETKPLPDRTDPYYFI